MKKTTLLGIFVFFSTLLSYGQTYPVSNLTYTTEYYDGPTYYKLSWDFEDPQNELIGFNIYKGNELYAFETDSFICYDLESLPPCTNNSPEFLDNPPFWAHVTAVYSSSHQESTYTDSIYIEGALIGIKEIKPLAKTFLHPNPTSGKLFITHQDIEKIKLFDLGGKLILEFGPVTEMNLSQLPEGIYLVKLISGKKTFLEKISVE